MSRPTLDNALQSARSVNESGVGIAFITDPWGTYIEINERPGQ